jgi:hypothetical protein
VHASPGGMQKLSKEWSLFVAFPDRRSHALDFLAHHMGGHLWEE